MASDDYELELEKIKEQLKFEFNPHRLKELYEQFCELTDVEPQSSLEMTQKQLMDAQLQGKLPHSEATLEAWSSLKGGLEERVLSKGIDNLLDLKLREERGQAPSAEQHFHEVEKLQPDPDESPSTNPNWPPKPSPYNDKK